MLHDKEKGNEAVDGDYGQTVVSAYLDYLKIFTVPQYSQSTQLLWLFLFQVGKKLEAEEAFCSKA